jgi:glycerate kinase
MPRMPLPGIPTTILLAPESFKGTLAATDVAHAIGRGLRAAGRPVDLCPVADGGEGTLSVMAEALDAPLQPVRASDPLGRPIEAQIALKGELAIVEAAAANGLALVDEAEREPIAASTFGVGELISAAVAADARTIYVGVGGSATTDGGAGALRAIREAGGPRDARLVVLCDVRTEFEQAARVFGPQKGADPGQVVRLTKRLHDLARQLPRDPRGVPMTGAAGGLAGGLWAALGAQLVPGAPFVLDTLGFDPRMRAARAVVTGEGRLDAQSLAGKAVSEVATRARQAGVPCHAIVGELALDAFGARILDLQAVLEARTPAEIERAAGRLSKLI